MRLVKFLKEDGSMAPFSSGTELTPMPGRMKELVPTKKVPYKLRFVRKKKRMVAVKPEEKATSKKTHYGGIKDVSRYKAWTEVGSGEHWGTSTQTGRM